MTDDWLKRPLDLDDRPVARATSSGARAQRDEQDRFKVYQPTFEDECDPPALDRYDWRRLHYYAIGPEMPMPHMLGRFAWWWRFWMLEDQGWIVRHIVMQGGGVYTLLIIALCLFMSWGLK